MRSPALISTRLRIGCHAVLASLSRRYPPLEGRSPTCYSPVRHSTQGRSPFRVRLACVRHAASVDSEPGSNSQVKSDTRDTPCEAPRATFQPEELSRPFCVVCLVCDGSSVSPSACAGRSDPVPPAVTRRAGFCTLYLVFKEPTRRTRRFYLTWSGVPSRLAAPVRGTF